MGKPASMYLHNFDNFWHSYFRITVLDSLFIHIHYKKCNGNKNYAKWDIFSRIKLDMPFWSLLVDGTVPWVRQSLHSTETRTASKENTYGFCSCAVLSPLLFRILQIVFGLILQHYSFFCPTSLQKKPIPYDKSIKRMIACCRSICIHI